MLFSNSASNFATDGYCNWTHAARDLCNHETSQNHFKSMQWYLSRRHEAKCGSTIERALHDQFNAEVQHWREVLRRFLSILRFLAEHDIAIRGTGGHEHLGDSKNGPFLALVEMMALYDSVLAEHLRRIQSKQISDHYMSHTIQDEFIELLGKKVLDTILELIQVDRYYSIILDCTPDVNHEEQMTMIICHVHATDDGIIIYEHFVGFLQVNKSTGSNLVSVLLKRLDELGLDIMNCKGQGYDNGANMAGRHSGVQSRVLQINPQARFVPCSSHSLNLILCDCAKTNVTFFSFFCTIQKLYSKLSSSTKRWKVLKDNCPLLVKYPSETRWESRVNSVKVVYSHLAGVLKTMQLILQDVSDATDCDDLRGIFSQLTKFETVLSCVIWYKVLCKVNFVSKHLQSISMDVDMAITLLDSLLSWIKDFRENGFNEVLQRAKDIANEANDNLGEVTVNTTFTEKRTNAGLNLQQEFRIDVFLTVLDKFKTSISNRFTQLQGYSRDFSLILKLPSLTTDMFVHEVAELQRQCQNLSTILGNAIDGAELYSELEFFVHLLNCQHLNNAKDILEYLTKQKITDTLPNLYTALKILATMPVSVASGERSFSKLKLIKTYLRSNISQYRLNGLAMMSVERAISKSIDFTEIIDHFALRKARKQNFI